MIRSHGHVIPREDGVKARCGGPALCRQCALEQEIMGLRTIILDVADWAFSILPPPGPYHPALGALLRKAQDIGRTHPELSTATPEATLPGEASTLDEDSRSPELPPCSCPAQPRTGEIVCCRHDAAGYGVSCRKEGSP